MKTILILAAAAATLTAAPALAQELGAGQVRVGYADLDLSTRAGVRTLDRRIRSAVELACGPISSFDLRGKNIVLDCRAETLAEARSQRDVAIAAASSANPVQLAAQH
jgi:UrcA family protein